MDSNNMLTCGIIGSNGRIVQRANAQYTWIGICPVITVSKFTISE